MNPTSPPCRRLAETHVRTPPHARRDPPARGQGRALTLELVIDASVAIKWVIDEPGTEAALSLRRFRLSAPDLLSAECANILFKKVRRKELFREEALVAARLLERADVELVSMRNMLERAVDLSLALDQPAYDCLYLTLAQATGRAFVTADERLCGKLRSCGSPIGIHHLDAAPDLLAGPGDR